MNKCLIAVQGRHTHNTYRGLRSAYKYVQIIVIFKIDNHKQRHVWTVQKGRFQSRYNNYFRNEDTSLFFLLAYILPDMDH